MLQPSHHLELLHVHDLDCVIHTGIQQMHSRVRRKRENAYGSLEWQGRDAHSRCAIQDHQAVLAARAHIEAAIQGQQTGRTLGGRKRRQHTHVGDHTDRVAVLMRYIDTAR